MATGSGSRWDSESECSASDVEWAYFASLLYLRSKWAAGFIELEFLLVSDATSSVVMTLTLLSSLYLRLPSLLR